MKAVTEMNNWSDESKYWQRFMQRMRAMRDKGELCDVSLEPENGEPVLAHRSFLAASSSYFYAMFCQNLREIHMKTVKMKGIDEVGLKVVVGFLYTRTLKLDSENVERVLYAANLLQIKEVEERCVRFVRENIDACNCLGVMRLAHALGLNTLYVLAKKFCLQNFKDIVHYDEFLAIPVDTLVFLLKDDCISVSNERIVYQAAMKWISYDRGERSKHLEEILSAIRLYAMDLDYLCEEIQTNEYIRKEPKAKSMITSVIDFKRLSPSDKIKQASGENLKPRDATKFANSILTIGGRCTEVTQVSKEMLDFDLNTWRTLPSSPRDCYGCSCLALNSSVVVIGGLRDMVSSSHCFSLTKGNSIFQEVRFPSLTTPRAYHGSALLNGGLYAIGGSSGTDNLSSVEYFSFEKNSWMKGKSLPHPLQYSAVCTHDNVIFSVGGHDGKNRLSSVLCFDQYLDTWSKLSSLEEPRSLAGALSFDGRLLLIGGFNGTHYLSTVQAFDTREGKWQSLSSLEERRAAFGLSVLHGMVYVAGGFHGSFVKSTEYFDPRKNQWFRGKDMNYAKAHFCMAPI